MKKLFVWLAAMLLLAVPVMAEEIDVQAEANAAYARVLLEGEAFSPLEDSVRMPGEWKAVRFTLLDMDGDGVSECIAELTEPEGFIILVYHNGAVYGGEFVYRGLMTLKDDGTFSFSSGAADNGVAQLAFTAEEAVGLTGMVYLPLAESFTAADGSVQYALDGGTQPTDEAAYRAFLAEQDAKLDALWYDYTEEYITMLLGR